VPGLAVEALQPVDYCDLLPSLWSQYDTANNPQMAEYIENLWANVIEWKLQKDYEKFKAEHTHPNMWRRV